MIAPEFCLLRFHLLIDTHYLSFSRVTFRANSSWSSLSKSSLICQPFFIAFHSLSTPHSLLSDPLWTLVRSLTSKWLRALALVASSTRTNCSTSGRVRSSLLTFRGNAVTNFLFMKVSSFTPAVLARRFSLLMEMSIGSSFHRNASSCLNATNASIPNVSLVFPLWLSGLTCICPPFPSRTPARFLRSALARS